MGKLFFYSDQIIESPGNQRLDSILLGGLNADEIKIGYIPSTEDQDKKYFKEKVQYYQNYGVQNILFFDLYSEFNSRKIEELLSCDIIHLSAGNPIEFRNQIRARKMDTYLRDYFRQGGTIVGVSGGAVQFGKSANLFQMFTKGLKETLNMDSNLNVLGLVDFEFLPHFNRWTDDFKNDVLRYTDFMQTTVYASKDGDGIIVEEGKIQLVGDITILRNN